MTRGGSFFPRRIGPASFHGWWVLNSKNREGMKDFACANHLRDGPSLAKEIDLFTTAGRKVYLYPMGKIMLT